MFRIVPRSMERSEDEEEKDGDRSDAERNPKRKVRHALRDQ